MATRTYVANAADIKHVATAAVTGTWLAAETTTLTIDNVDFVITIGSLVTTAQVAATISQAFGGTPLTDTTGASSPTITQGGAQAIGQFGAITASVSGSTVTLTADTAAIPFTMTNAETSVSGGITFSAAVTTATGKTKFTNQDNWSANTVPIDNDDVVFDSGAQNVTDGLSPAIQPASFTKTKAFTGKIGLAEVNADDVQLPYGEYRTKSLTFSNNSVTTTYNLENGDGQGSSRVRIAAGAGQSIVNVFGQATRELTAVPCILFTGTHASNALNNLNGDVGVAFYASETSTLATLRNGTDQAGSQAKTYCGTGVTLSGCTITVLGGTLVTNTAILAITITGGEHTHQAGTITTLNIDGGKFISKFQGTITTCRVTGTFDKTQDLRPVTITNAVQLYKGGKILDPAGTITFSAGIVLNRCKISDVTLDLGTNRTITPS